MPSSVVLSLALLSLALGSHPIETRVSDLDGSIAFVADLAVVGVARPSGTEVVLDVLLPEGTVSVSCDESRCRARAEVDAESLKVRMWALLFAADLRTDAGVCLGWSVLTVLASTFELARAVDFADETIRACWSAPAMPRGAARSS